jgi:hypothetical protein
MPSLQDALGQFNTDKPGWYGWTDSSLGMVYSNVKLNDDTATMPTEEEVNAKIAELQIQENRRNEYPALAEQLDYIYHNGLTKWKSDIIKPVKDKYPKG